MSTSTFYRGSHPSPISEDIHLQFTWRVRRDRAPPQSQQVPEILLVAIAPSVISAVVARSIDRIFLCLGLVNTSRVLHVIPSYRRPRTFPRVPASKPKSHLEICVTIVFTTQLNRYTVPIPRSATPFGTGAPSHAGTGIDRLSRRPKWSVAKRSRNLRRVTNHG